MTAMIMLMVEHEGQRVITTELLAQAYETDTDNIKHNYNNHKENFKEGIHYYRLKGDALRAFKREVNDIPLVAPNVNQLYLWTERGANRHCKILDTPKVWEQFDNLEETYFLVKEYKRELETKVSLLYLLLSSTTSSVSTDIIRYRPILIRVSLTRIGLLRRDTGYWPLNNLPRIIG